MHRSSPVKCTQDFNLCEQMRTKLLNAFAIVWGVDFSILQNRLKLTKASVQVSILSPQNKEQRGLSTR